MKLLRKYLIVFTTCCLLGAVFLRVYAMFFFYHKPEDFISGMGLTLVITCIMDAIFCLFFIKPIRNVENVVQKVLNNQTITEQERSEALSCYSRVVVINIIENIIGFVVGQVIVMSLDFMNGVVPYTFERALMIVIQATLVGGMAALYESYIFNNMMAAPRKLLKIESLDGFGKKSINMTVSSKVLLVSIASLLFMACNMFSTPFYLILDSEFSESQRLTNYLVYGLCSFLLSGALCIGLILIVTQEFKQRITKTSKLIKNLGENGELSSRISLEMNDDLGELAGNMNFFMNTLSNTVISLRNETSKVSKSAKILADTVKEAESANNSMHKSIEKIDTETKNQIVLIEDAKVSALKMNENAANVALQVELQSSALQQSSAAVNEMAANINSVAEMTKKADNLSTILQSSSSEGGQYLASAVKAIQEIQEASVEVQTIIKVIQKISSQTNLLSMNAAIEAAHAGDAGAGFAVVADEVRGLAASSTKSAKEIQLHIKDMVEKVNFGVDSINAAGKAFSSINKSIEQTSGLMQTISNAMEEQRTGAHETLLATESVVDSIHVIEELSNKQKKYTDSMKHNVEEIVSSSSLVTQAINENTENSSNMFAAIDNVAKTADLNKQAVVEMQKSINMFKLRE